eukprot:Gb_14054 [translate_table: standard]
MGGGSRRVEDCSEATASPIYYNNSNSWKRSLSRNISRHGDLDDQPGRSNHETGHGVISLGEIMGSDEVHKVGIPEPKSVVNQFNAKVKEILFPDDPLRQFKGQPCGRQCWLGFQYFFPILEWAPKYSLALLKSDIVSGLTIASLAIPQGISYAKLASLPPIIGLYSSFVPPLIYAILGSSRDLAVGPVSIASLLLGAMLREEVSPITDPVLYLQVAFTATFFAGVFQASLGILRLGFIIDFLSRATLVGFMAGAAVIVSLQQFKGLLGIEHFTPKMDLVSVMYSVFERTHEWAWQTALMGVSFVILLLTARCISKRKASLFWVSAAAPLTSVIVATIFVFATRADKHGISISTTHGTIATDWALAERSESAFPAHAAFQCHLSITRNENRACDWTHLTHGSFSRSAVNYNAGCKSAVSNIVMAATVMITLLLLTPLFYYTPGVVLSAIIVAAVVGLIDIPAAYIIWKVDKVDFIACLGAFMGVIFISVQVGLLIAVGISLLKILLHVTRPHIVLLGNIPGTTLYRNIEQYKEASRVPASLILSIDAPIYFANSTYLRERILRWVQDEEDRIEKEKINTLQYVILDLTAVTSIDTTGIYSLIEVKKTLMKRGYAGKSRGRSDGEAATSKCNGQFGQGLLLSHSG